MWANDSGLEVEQIKLGNIVQVYCRSWWGVKSKLSVKMQQVVQLCLLSYRNFNQCYLNIIQMISGKVFALENDDKF